MINTNLAIWPDTTTSDRGHCELIGDKECSVEAEQFLITEPSLGVPLYRFLLKVDGRPVNFSPALARDDPAAFSAIAKKLQGVIKTMSMEMSNLLHYRGRLIARENIETGEISEALSAPMLGSLVRPATEQECIRCLDLPPMIAGTRIGKVFHADISLCIADYVLRHHFLLSGATGQGKTTCISNLVKGAYNLGATVFVFDFKPDYQYVEESSCIPRGDVSYWNLNEKRPFRKDAHQVNVDFSDISPELYISKAAGTDVQYDVFMHMLMRFDEDKRERGEVPYSFDEFYKAVPKSENDKERINRLYPGGDAPNRATLNACYRLRNAKPNWVDVEKKAIGMISSSSKSPSFFSHNTFLEKGHIHVIQVNPSLDKDYGLFLTTLLEKILIKREDDNSKHPIFIVIDEAQDIFSGSDFAKRCETTIAGVVRKGRSQNIGVSICVQDPSSVPDGISQNLNSIIAFRHNSDHAAASIKKRLGNDAANIQSLEPGNAIVHLFKSKSAVRATLDQEAFRLVKTDE